MRKFKMGLITLVASAAVMIPAASASAASSTASKASTATNLGCVLVCFDIHDVDIASGNDVITDNNVDLVTATVKCTGVNLQLLSIGQDSDTCTNSKPGHKKYAHRRS